MGTSDGDQGDQVPGVVATVSAATVGKSTGAVRRARVALMGKAHRVRPAVRLCDFEHSFDEWVSWADGSREWRQCRRCGVVEDRRPDGAGAVNRGAFSTR